MSKMATVITVLLVIIGSYLVIRYVKDSYKILPINEKNPLEATNINIPNWREYADVNGLFKALLPSLPQHATDKIADPITKEPRKFDMYAAANNKGTAYIISATTFPENIKDEDIKSILRSAVNDVLARNKENKLKMTKSGKFRDLHSFDFALENADATVVGKAILKDNTLYVLSAIDKSDSFNVEEFDYFINSFTISDGVNKDTLKAQKRPAVAKPQKPINQPAE